METLEAEFALLAEPIRLRLVRVLAREALNVTELVAVLGVAQSTVSHHLSKLKAREWLDEQRQGAWVYYRVRGGQAGRSGLLALIRAAPDAEGDLARLAEVLATRKDAVGHSERLLEPGQGWRVWARALGTLMPPLECADFGCGTGALSIELARSARRVIGVDRDERLLRAARLRAQKAGLRNVRFLKADLEQLPLPDSSVDLIVLSQSLHHVEHPEAVLAQAHRILRPDGRALVLELMPHRETWTQTKLGHAWPGFAPAALERRLSGAGFQVRERATFPRDEQNPFRPFLLSAVRVST